MPYIRELLAMKIKLVDLRHEDMVVVEKTAAQKTALQSRYP